MLDHVFTDAIGSLTDALEAALLERQALEERLSSDLLLGDVVFETSYSIPGEGTPPRSQADVTLSWPTWAQSAYRTWYLEERFSEPPTIDVDIVLRVQRLLNPPDPNMVIEAIPLPTPPLGRESLAILGLTLESGFDADVSATSRACEISFGGTYELSEAVLENGAALDHTFNTVGGWIATSLVRLGDLPLRFAPPTT